MLFLAAHDSPFARINFHCFDKLLFSVHALELNVDIAASGLVVLLVSLSLFHYYSCFALKLPDFLSYIFKSFFSLLRLWLSLNLLYTFVDFLLLEK